MCSHTPPTEAHRANVLGSTLLPQEPQNRIHLSGAQTLQKPHMSQAARSLRSSGETLLAVPKWRLTSKGDRAFGIRAPRLWNDLPEEIRLAESLTYFKLLLKTHFYRLPFYAMLFLLPLFFDCFDS